MFIVLPATANLLGQAAHGMAANLLTTTILASPEPVVFFPNANDLMWRKKVVQRNIELLREDGHVIVEPTLRTGYEAASGEVRENWVLPRPEQAVNHLRHVYQRSESSDSFNNYVPDLAEKRQTAYGRSTSGTETVG